MKKIIFHREVLVDSDDSPSNLIVPNDAVIDNVEYAGGTFDVIWHSVAVIRVQGRTK